MSGCERCRNLEYEIRRLEDVIREQKNEIQTERRKTDDYDSVKSRRDELQRSVDRSYDSYVTTPKGMP